jgi:hypothetical protein
MLPRIRAVGYPVALVAQDGLEHADVPRRHIDALFTGGSTAFKTGPAAAALAAQARRRGLWVHMGGSTADAGSGTPPRSAATRRSTRGSHADMDVRARAAAVECSIAPNLPAFTRPVRT